jgi:bifunctional UDP-N-acetylglucosamine pyrophosphorylase/glucosamine-1-phosphate N-acetyltransferase
MKSDLPKMLLPALDQPVLFYILETLRQCASSSKGILQSFAAVIGHKGEMVQDYLSSEWPEVVPLWQHEQLGTGHAVQIAKEWWSGLDNLLVLPGDVPLLTEDGISTLIGGHASSGADCSFISFRASNPSGYGRVLRQQEDVSVIEEKDATEEQKLLTEVNSGIYIFKTSSLLSHIYRLDNENAQGEYYLPDIIAMMVRSGGKVNASLAGDENEFGGINTPLQLSEAVAHLRRRLVHKHLAAGVRMQDPGSVWIGPRVTVDDDVVLEPSVQLWGKTSVGRGSRIGSFSILRNAVLEENVDVVSHASLSDSVFRRGSRLGPFIVVRDGAVFDENSQGGKFVEVKKSTIGCGSKVPHLSYVGDAVIGRETNIGAGTITCNYDGRNKNPTFIGDRCFIGSDTMIVAPVRIGDEGFTAAGSVITQDVPEGALAVGRARQRNIEGWVKRAGKKQAD